MNEFEGWNKILLEWREVNRIKRLNQELYDLLGGTLLQILDYTKKHDVAMPNIDSTTKRIHELMDEIDSPTQDEQPYRNNRKRNNTLKLVACQSTEINY